MQDVGVGQSECQDPTTKTVAPTATATFTPRRRCDDPGRAKTPLPQLLQPGKSTTAGRVPGSRLTYHDATAPLRRRARPRSVRSAADQRKIDRGTPTARQQLQLALVAESKQRVCEGHRAYDPGAQGPRPQLTGRQVSTHERKNVEKKEAEVVPNGLADKPWPTVRHRVACQRSLKAELDRQPKHLCIEEVQGRSSKA